MIRPPMLFDQSANIYDAVYAARGKDYAAEAARVVELVREAGISSGGRLLDVACGTGEHLKHLKSQFDVTGVDRSRAMLDVARLKLPGVPLHEQSMTALEFGRTFHIVTCLFSSIGYLDSLEDMRSAIQSMADHLEPDGLLLIEPAITREQLCPPRPFTMTAQHDGIDLTRHETAEVTADALIIRFDYELQRSGEVISRFTEIHPMLLLPRDAYLELGREAGLMVEWDEAGLCGRGLMVCRPC